MDYTQSDANVTDGGTGQRMHQDTAPITTEVSSDDVNGLTWEALELIKAAGLVPAAFDKTVPATYSQVRDAVAVMGRKKSAAIASATGSAEVLIGVYAPVVPALVNGLTLYLRAAYANATIAPTFTPNTGVIAAKAIIKGAGLALVAGDISGAGHWIELQYDLTLDKWVLLNPALGVGVPGSINNFLPAGYVIDGSVDYTAYFTAAQAAAPYIEVLAGQTFKVSAGLDYWKFFGSGTVIEPGRTWQLSRTPQTAQTQKVYRDTYGTFESAAGSSIAINRGAGQVNENTEVEGQTTQYLAANYSGRDHVGQYVAAYSFVPLSMPDAGATYTANSVTSVSIPGFLIKPGMLVDTAHASSYLGKVISVSGSIIVVDGWYLNGTGVAGTPANGKGATINPNTKIWCHNANLHLVAGAQANAGTGFELGLLALKPGTGAGCVGFDAVTLLGSEPVYAHFVARGAAQRGFRNDGFKTYGFESETSAEFNFWSKQDKASAGAREGFRSQNAKVGFRSVGDTKGIVIDDATGNALEVSIAGVPRTAINSVGKFAGLFMNPASYGANGVIAADVTFAVGLGSPVNLPPVITEDGQVVFFSNQTGSPITVNGNGHTISGGASTSIISLGGMMFVSFGGNWLITVL